VNGQVTAYASLASIDLDIPTRIDYNGGIMEKIVITKLRGKPKDWDYRVNGKVHRQPSVVWELTSDLITGACRKASEPIDFTKALDQVLMWSICFTAVHMLYIYLGR
jgi:hypothetical protein